MNYVQILIDAEGMRLPPRFRLSIIQNSARTAEQKCCRNEQK